MPGGIYILQKKWILYYCKGDTPIRYIYYQNIL